MRKIAICVAAAAYLGTAGIAVAGSMSMKDEPVYVPPSTWTGFYVGLGVGAGAVVHELDVNAYQDVYKRDCSYKGGCSDYYFYEENDFSFNFDGIGGEGIFGTVQVGYDWQYAPRAVVGLFGDFDWSGIGTDLSFSASQDGYKYLSANGEADLEWMWTIGIRFGYLATPDTLIYMLAGYTQANFDDPSLTINFDGYKETASTSLDTFKGYTLGVGMETRLDANWALKLEYRFTQLSSENLFSFYDSYYEGGFCNYCYDSKKYYVEEGVSADLEPSIHTGRVVLTYRIGEVHEPMESLK